MKREAAEESSTETRPELERCVIGESDRRTEVTRLLQRLSDDSGDTESSRNRLFEVVYDDLRDAASRIMRRERADHTLQPTALVNEAFLRLSDPGHVQWESRSHFVGVAARAMRQILVDHARDRSALKRGGHLQKVTLVTEPDPSSEGEFEVLSLHSALEKLEALDERAARVVELRAFGGLTMSEVAEVIGVSKRTVDGDWTFARHWLSRELA